MRHISPRQLKLYLEQVESPPLLLDVRERWEHQICHLTGSQFLPMRQVPAAYPNLNRNRETVVICHHGVRSHQVAYFLEQMGFENVINLTGGLAAWAREVDSNMPIY